MTERELISKFISESIRLRIFITQKFVWLTNEQLNFRPLPGKWSVGECFNHLIISHRLYFDKLAEIYNDGKYTSAEPESIVEHSFFGRILINAVRPDSVKRIKTFKIFQPVKINIDDSIFEEFNLLQDKFVRLIEGFDSVYLSGTKLSSPVSKFIKLNAADVLMIIIHHNNRHINQAEKIVNLCFFPKDKHKNGISPR